MDGFLTLDCVSQRQLGKVSFILDNWYCKSSFTKKLDAFIFSEIALVTINWYQVFVSSILIITRLITGPDGLYLVLLPLLISRI